MSPGVDRDKSGRFRRLVSTENSCKGLEIHSGEGIEQPVSRPSGQALDVQGQAAGSPLSAKN
jgi:hypothetical protein